MNFIRGLIAPWRFNKNTEGFGIEGKVIAALYFFPILIMWYGYYMWKKE